MSSSVISRGRNQLTSLFSRAWVQWLVASVVFFLLSWLFMGSAITSCNDVSPAFNSDTSGGTAWFQWASGNGLEWTSTTKSNFPEGEELYRPQFVTSTTFAQPYRLLASLTSPLCGLNLMILLGYMMAALLMFGLARWLFKRQSLAYFAGFAAAFVPYHQIKTHSHVVYMFGGIFTAIIWAFLWFLQKPNFKRAALWAGVSAIAIYMDGYFILLTCLLLMGLLISLLTKDIAADWSKAKHPKFKLLLSNMVANFRRYLKPGLVFAGVLIVLLIPIIKVQTTQQNDIKQSLAAARGNIQIEAASYGARVWEFLAPPIYGLATPDEYDTWRLARLHNSNPSEATVFVGFTIFILALVGAVSWLWRRQRQQELQPNIRNGFLIGMLVICLALLGSFTLQSYIHLFGQAIPTPVAVLIKFTANWRVLTRVFLVVQPLMVLLASAGLFFAASRLSKLKANLLIVASIGLIVVEFLPWPLHFNGSLSKSTPAVYQQLKKDSSVQTIAEYPLTDMVLVPTVFTYQPLHGKNVINANDSAILRSPKFQSMAGVADTQTLGVLKARGVQLIVTHGFEMPSSPNIALYKADNKSKIFSYKLTSALPARPYQLTVVSGFDPTTVGTNQVSHHVLSRPGKLKIVPSHSKVNRGQGAEYRVQFTAQSFNTPSANVVVRQNGQVVWQGSVSQQASLIEFTGSDRDMTVTVDKPIDITNLSAFAQ